LKLDSSYLLIFFCLILVSSFAIASKTTSTTSGNWINSGTWDNGVPTCGDTVIIAPGHTVLITNNVNLDESSTPACSTAMYIEVRGILGFQTGKKLYTPCGSAVYLTSTGILLKGSGGGNSNLIEVCGTGIWNAGDGNVTGPQYIGSPLPITLKYFNAELISEVVLLNWVTLSEVNNEEFTIERSTDLNTLTEVVSVPGAGNSREELAYKASDLNPLNGIQYYRLKQTDYDGKVTKSDWVAINCNRNEIKNINVHPTLVQNQFHINFNNQKESSAKIYLHDSKGHLLLRQETEINTDSFVWTSNNAIKYSTGQMILTIYIDDEIHRFKLIHK